MTHGYEKEYIAFISKKSENDKALSSSKPKRGGHTKTSLRRLENTLQTKKLNNYSVDHGLLPSKESEGTKLPSIKRKNVQEDELMKLIRKN